MLQSGRFCYKSLNTPICCESGERNIDEDVLIKKILQRNKPEKEGSIGWSVLKYTPLTTAQRQQHENELLQYDNQLESDVSNVSRQPVLDRTTSEVVILFRLSTNISLNLRQMEFKDTSFCFFI